MTVDKVKTEQAGKHLAFLEKYSNATGISKAEFLLLVMAVSGAIKLETVDQDEGIPVIENTTKLLAILESIEFAMGVRKAGAQFESLSDEEVEAIADGTAEDPFEKL